MAHFDFFDHLISSLISILSHRYGDCCGSDVNSEAMNYNKWDKFDPDLVCKEIDVQQSIESSKQAKKKAFVAAASENEAALTNAKKAAEALQSQVCY
jgi:hypothetical protein